MSLWSFSTSATSASVMNSHAGSAAMVSRPISTSMEAATSVTDSAVTTAPRFGSMVTSPSASRILKASRSGVREMPSSCSLISRSEMRCPGVRAPETISSRTRRAASRVRLPRSWPLEFMGASVTDCIQSEGYTVPG